MKANELMIGDWVWYNNQPHQIRQLGIFGENRDGDDYPAVCVGKPNGVGLILERNEIEPIPLTPEILEKNGWYHAKFDGSYGRKAMRIDGYYQDELPKGVDNALSFAQWSIDEKFMYHMLEIFMWVGSIHLKIEYVHELQHALRSCGIEKEIEL